MFTKSILAALILATASVALAAKVNAGPAKPADHQFPAEQSWMDRASQVTDGGSQ